MQGIYNTSTPYCNLSDTIIRYPTVKTYIWIEEGINSDKDAPLDELLILSIVSKLALGFSPPSLTLAGLDEHIRQVLT